MWRDFANEMKARYYGVPIRGDVAKIATDAFKKVKGEHGTYGKFEYESFLFEVSVGRTRYTPPGGEMWADDVVERLASFRLVMMDKITPIYLHHIRFLVDVDQSLKIRHIQENHNSIMRKEAEDPYEGVEDPDEIEALDEKYDIEYAVTDEEHRYCEAVLARFLQVITSA